MATIQEVNKAISEGSGVRVLPRIKFKGVVYIFDYRLSELRELLTAKSIFLNMQETELLNYAISQKDKSLIKINMQELTYKL